MEKGWGKMLQPKSPCSSPDPKPQESPTPGAGAAEPRAQCYPSKTSPRPQKLPQNNAAEEIAGVYGCVFFKPPDGHREASADEATVPLTLSGRDLLTTPCAETSHSLGIIFRNVKNPVLSLDTERGRHEASGKKQACVSKNGL